LRVSLRLARIPTASLNGLVYRPLRLFVAIGRKCPDSRSEHFFNSVGVGVRQFILFDQPPMRPGGGVIARSQVVKLGK
jgi:hypothetical protein